MAEESNRIKVILEGDESQLALSLQRSQASFNNFVRNLQANSARLAEMATSTAVHWGQVGKALGTTGAAIQSQWDKSLSRLTNRNDVAFNTLKSAFMDAARQSGVSAKAAAEEWERGFGKSLKTTSQKAQEARARIKALTDEADRFNRVKAKVNTINFLNNYNREISALKQQTAEAEKFARVQERINKLMILRNYDNKARGTAQLNQLQGGLKEGILNTVAHSLPFGVGRTLAFTGLNLTHFSQMAEQAKLAGKELTGVNAAIANMAGMLGRIPMGVLALFAGGILAIKGAFELATSAATKLIGFVKEGFNYNDLIRNTELGMAGLLFQMTEIYRGQNEITNAADKWNAALEISGDLVKQLQGAALQTRSVFSELARGMQEGFGPMLQAGVKQDQVTPFVTRFVHAMNTLRVPMREIGQEMRAFFNLESNPRTARVSFVMLGEAAKQFGTDLEGAKEKLEELKAAGRLDEWFMANTKGMAVAGQESMKTLSGYISNLKEAFEQGLGAGTKEHFPKLLEIIDKVYSSLVQVDEQGKVTFNETFLSVIDSAAAAFVGVADSIATIIGKFVGPGGLISVTKEWFNITAGADGGEGWGSKLVEYGIKKNPLLQGQYALTKGALKVSPLGFLGSQAMTFFEWESQRRNAKSPGDLGNYPLQGDAAAQATQFADSQRFNLAQNLLEKAEQEGDKAAFDKALQDLRTQQVEADLEFAERMKAAIDKQLDSMSPKAKGYLELANKAKEFEDKIEQHRGTIREIQNDPYYKVTVDPAGETEEQKKAREKAQRERERALEEWKRKHEEALTWVAARTEEFVEKSEEAYIALGVQQKQYSKETGDFLKKNLDLDQTVLDIEQELLKRKDHLPVEDVAKVENLLKHMREYVRVQKEINANDWSNSLVKNIKFLHPVTQKPIDKSEYDKYMEQQREGEAWADHEIERQRKEYVDYTMKKFAQAQDYFVASAGDLFSTLAIEGGKGFGTVAARNFNKMIQEGSDILGQKLFAWIMGDARKDESGNWTINGQPVSTEDIPALERKNTQMRGVQTGLQLAQIGLGAYQGGRSGADGSITAGVMGGAMAGLSTGNVWMAVAGAIVGGLSAALGKAAARDEYKFARFRLDAQGNWSIPAHGSKNIEEPEQEAMIARVQEQFDKFYTGYIKILANFGNLAALPNLAQTMGIGPFGGKDFFIQDEASKNFLKHFEEWLNGTLPDEIGKMFKDSLTGIATGLGMGAEQFEALWDKFDTLDPSKTLELLNTLFQALKNFSEIDKFYQGGVDSQGYDSLADLGMSGFNSLVGQRMIHPYDAAEQIRSNDDQIRQTAATLLALPINSEAAVQTAQELSDLIIDRMEREKALAQEIASFLIQSARNFESLQRSLTLDTLGTMTTDEQGNQVWEADLQAQVDYLDAYLDTVITGIRNAKSVEELRYWENEYFQTTSQMGQIYQQMGPEAYQAYVQWMLKDTMPMFQTAIKDATIRIGTEITNATTALFADIKPAMDLFRDGLNTTATTTTDAMNKVTTSAVRVGDSLARLADILDGISGPNQPVEEARTGTDKSYEKRVVINRTRINR